MDFQLVLRKNDGKAIMSFRDEEIILLLLLFPYALVALYPTSFTAKSMESTVEEDNTSIVEIQGELSTTEVKEEVDDDDTVIGFEMEEAEIVPDVPQTPDAVPFFF